MTGVVANLLVNVVMIGLLCATIGYCWVLNRRIKVLQDSKSELAQLLRHFDESTERASESIIALQTASKKIGENIQMRIDKANYVLDDLSFMLEKGNRLANQIEAGIAVSRAKSRVAPSAVAEAPAAEERPVPMPQRPPSSRERTVASLEALLERVTSRNKTPKVEPKEVADDLRQTVRSKSEQELLAMLKAGVRG